MFCKSVSSAICLCQSKDLEEIYQPKRKLKKRALKSKQTILPKCAPPGVQVASRWRLSAKSVCVFLARQLPKHFRLRSHPVALPIPRFFIRKRAPKPPFLSLLNDSREIHYWQGGGEDGGGSWLADLVMYIETYTSIYTTEMILAHFGQPRNMVPDPVLAR